MMNRSKTAKTKLRAIARDSEYGISDRLHVTRCEVERLIAAAKGSRNEARDLV
jgi:hypothetical protein